MASVTLSQHIKIYDKDLQKAVLKIAEASKIIKKGFYARQGTTDSYNIFGEKQLSLDKWADEMLVSMLGKEGLVKKITTEEQPEIIDFPSTSDLALTIDPLDGSSLIGTNLTVGTIVGFHRGEVMKRGEELIGALYILYGPLTVLVYSFGNGVHEFVLDENSEFILSNENIVIPDGKIISPGALRSEWFKFHSRWVEQLEEMKYKLRYSGSFVADIHQILHKGGIFAYPGFKGRVDGKLRLLYECIPMGYIIKQAGGAVSDGKQDVLTISPNSTQDRTPIYIGGRKEIKLIEKMKKVM